MNTVTPRPRRSRDGAGARYHALVFIGRFQPFHKGHQRVVDRAIELAERVVILVGSANSPRTLRNPLSFAERAAIIQAVYGDAVTSGRLVIAPLDDHLYNDTGWVEATQVAVRTILGSIDGRLGLIGCSKDHTSYYPKLFPKPRWGSEDVAFLDPINATDIRHALFDDDGWDQACDQLPAAAARFMEAWRETPECRALIRERDFIRRYKSQFSFWPYPSGPVFVTADAIVVQSGHILMIRRKAMPGEGMLALPGGFLEDDETLAQCAIRELREETRIDVPEPVLRGAIVDSRLFDAPHRSSRGRVITQAVLFRLEDRAELPRVKGGDDAALALWVPLAELEPLQLFEDHWHIIRAMTASL